MGIIKNDRAQFMLLAGFIISIGLVITTVMLNNIIFESNMAGEAGGDSMKYDVVNLMRISGDEMKSTYRNVTATGQNPTLKIINFNNQMQNFNRNLSLIYAMHDECVNLSWDIKNWNSTPPSYANFTENGTANGARNWTLIESVKSLFLFELRNVSGSNFEVNISNQTTGAFLWSMKLTGGSGIEIRNYSAPNNPISYGVNYEYINLTNSTYKLVTIIGSNSSKITYLNGANVSGRFNITGNTSNNRSFISARDHILNATIVFSTSDTRANITIPVSVPW